MMLESRDHPAAFFITLTYKDECLPDGENLSKHQLQLFLKLLRRRIEPAHLRYVAVGEYGSRFGRPHYHACIFTSIWITQELLQDVWAHGFVDVKLFGEWSASYIAGYIISDKDDQYLSRVGKRAPEFTLQSLKPGIGYGAAPAVAAEVFTRYGVEFLSETGDVPKVFRVNGKILPLGSYLVNKIRDLSSLDKGVLKYHKTKMRITTPPMTKEDVSALERRRIHGGHKARSAIRQHKAKGIL